MLSCPNENTPEWKEILDEAKGDRRKALETWIKRGYHKDKDLNEEVDNDTFKDVRQGLPDMVDPEKNTPFAKLVENIKVDLDKKLAMLERRLTVNKTEKQKKIQRLKTEIEAVEGVASINIFVDDAYQNCLKVSDYFSDILKEVETTDMSDISARKKALEKLSIIGDFATGYNILDEISKEDVYKFFSKEVDPSIPKDELTPQQKLSEAITIKNNIRNTYLKQGIPIMADFLLGYRSEDEIKNRNEIQSLRNRIRNILKDKGLSDERKKKKVEELEDRIAKFQSFSLEKQQLINILTQASKDEGIIDFLFEPLISSEDAAMGLFAKAVKSQFELARQKDIINLREISDEIEEYEKTTTASKNNKAEFYNGIYEIRTEKYTDKKTGEIKERKYAAFVEKYDVAKFRNNRNEFFDSVGDRPEPLDPENITPAEMNALKAYNRKVSAWFRENTEPLPEDERNAIIQTQEDLRARGVITPEEFDTWLSKVMKEDAYGNIIYMKELTRPSKKYINPKWNALYDQNDQPKNAKGKFHKELTDRYKRAQEKIPESQRPQFVLPSIPKSDMERAIENGLVDLTKANLSDAVALQAFDNQYGIGSLNEETVKFLPVLYTQQMDANDVSLDLAKSVAMFEAMANRYEAMNDIYNEINLFQTIIGEREVLETNSKGQPIIDAFAKKSGITEYLKKNGQSFSEMHVNAFIDMVIYGEMQKAEQVLGLSLGKITNTFTGISAITTISADLIKGLANNLQGNIQLIIEANSGEFFDKKNYFVGKKTYAKYLTGVLADFNRPVPKSFLGKLVEKYDPMQGSYKDQFGKDVTGTMASRLIRTDTLFFNQHCGEHEIQVSCMLALMDAVKVLDKTTNEQITLLKAYEKYGVDGVEENTDFTEKKRQAFQNRLHALSKRMHGVYNDFDKSTSSRFSLMRLVQMYRKHLVPGYKRRFKGLTYDNELESFTEGYYITFINTFIKDVRDYKFKVFNQWSTYSAFEKAQIKKVVAELTIIAAAWATIAVLRAAGDDDDELKKNYAYNLMLYEAIRMRSETASYINPYDAYRVVRSPSAITGTLERFIKFFDQFVLTWDPKKLEFKKKTGVWEKGDNKSWAYFLKLMGYSGYNITPEEAVKSYEGTLNK